MQMTSKLLCLKISQSKLVGQDVSVGVQSCLALCNPMDCSPPGPSAHGIFQARIQERSCHFLLQGIFPTRGSNPCLLGLLDWQVDSLPPRHLGSLEYFAKFFIWVFSTIFYFIESEDKIYLHIKHQVFYTFDWLNNIPLKMKHIVISINENRGNLILWCPKASSGEFAQGIIPLTI